VIFRRRPPSPPESGAISGTARVDRRTKELLARLQPGEIAVIDHEDIDRMAAEGLTNRQVAAVINAARSSTGRYPNLGPLLLCSAGIPVIDGAGPAVMELAEGTDVVIEEGKVFRSDNGDLVQVARGNLLDLETVEKTLDGTKAKIGEQIVSFAENTMSYIKDERRLLSDALHLPEVKTELQDRHVLIVVRGHHYREDLAALRPYIREMKPVLVAVDGGADALIDMGLRPAIILGDMDSVTTEALLCGAELVVHAYPGGMAPGAERLEALGLEHVVCEAAGTSEDVAMLLSHEKGAELIVAVGTHANLVEFLDKGRKGMASTFLTRLRVGPILVDAKGVNLLYRSRLRRRDLMLLLAAALVTMAAVVWLSEPMRLELQLVWQQIKNVWFSITQALF
jgi:uncharacterized membrane-anchored protein